MTYQQWDAAANGGSGGLVNVRKVLYAYYVTGVNEPNGLTGDLKTVTTQYWNGSAWTGGDTNYYRYYLDSAGGVGFAHGLRNHLLPNAYAALADYATQHSTTVDALPDSVVDNYTCYYYEYDPLTHRVTKDSVFGELRTETFAYTEGSIAQNANVWARKTVATTYLGDGSGAVASSTHTVYTNFLGETLLDDLVEAGGWPTPTPITNTIPTADN